MIIQRFQIFKHKGLLLNEDEGTKHYTAVSEEALQTGRVVPHTDLLLENEPIATVEAKSPAEAVQKYIENLQDSWM